VRDVEASPLVPTAGLRSDHGGPHYERPRRRWRRRAAVHHRETEHDNRPIGDAGAAPGNGVLVWFGEVADFDDVAQRAAQLEAAVVLAPHRNPPTGQGNGPAHRELWIKDPD
jgi:hypothetical protein